jgi:hypothetical protein
MDRYLRAFIDRIWLAFLVAGLASLYVGALGKSPYSGDVLSSNYSGPVLMVVGILLIAASIFFIVKKELQPPMPDTADLKLPAINAKDYALTIEEPENNSTRTSLIKITGTVAKGLPDELELWLVNHGGREGQVEYWPQDKVSIPAGKNKKQNWTHLYKAQNFKEGDKRELQFYIVGKDGQKLIRCFRRINERHVAKSENKEKPGYEAIPELVSDFVKVGDPLRLFLTHDSAKQNPPLKK